MFTTAYPATMSRRYDADFDAIYGGPDRGDIAFFVGLAGETSGSICEIGAGTGRVLFPVAHADPGRAVTAIEPSEAMRQCVEQNLHRDHPALVGRIALQAGSFQDIPLSDASQGYVFGAFRSFQHVLTVEDQLRALAEMKRVTQPGGLIAFDLFDPDYATLQTTEARCVAVAQGADGRVIEPRGAIGASAFSLDRTGPRWSHRGDRKRRLHGALYLSAGAAAPAGTGRIRGCATPWRPRPAAAG
jgi:ubiquinone/menaquinone biosynthesis C-methylase UbiE